MNKNHFTPFEYYLPNGAKIDIDDFIKASSMNLEDENSFPQFYLDTQTGNICEVLTAEALVNLVEKIGMSDRYLSISSMTEKNYAEILDFLIEMPGNPLSKAEKKKAKDMRAKAGWEAAVTYITSIAPEFPLIFEFEVRDYILEYVEHYMEEFPKGKIEKKFLGCGNCPACKNLKEGNVGMNHVRDGMAGLSFASFPSRG